MADIPGSESKMNDVEVAQGAALSEALHTKIGANINFLIDNKLGKDSVTSQTFTGNGTFTVPADVDTVFLYGRGGGGGGAGSSATVNGGGGAGSVSQFIGPVSVTPSSGVSVTIGAGGAGGAAGTNSGADGGDSSFGSIVFKGGHGGGKTPSDTDNVGGLTLDANAYGGRGPVPGGNAGMFGMRSYRALGGNVTFGDDGGGGGGGDGAGGTGGSLGSEAGVAGTDGGGGGGARAIGGGAAGGAGGGGQIIVIYFDPAL